MRFKELGPVLLAAAALVFYMESQQDSALDQFHSDLNALGKAQCEGNAKLDPIGHYNQLVLALIADYELRKRENEERGDVAKAVINAGTLTALRDSIIEAPPADCNKPLLP